MKKVHKLEWRGYEHICGAKVREEKCCSKDWKDVSCKVCLSLKGKRTGPKPYGAGT